MSDILAALAGEYPQLYLNPDSDAQETYRRVVLRGEEPETTRLNHYRGSEFDRMETVDTPAGPEYMRDTLRSRIIHMASGDFNPLSIWGTWS